MIRQYLRKNGKVAYGLLNTFLRPVGRAYRADDWWDRSFYTRGVSDRQTIAPGKSFVASLYHYAAVEALILRHVINHGVDLRGAAVADIGSGAGHWPEFYTSLGASRLHAIDVSGESVSHLRDRYADRADVSVHHGHARDVLGQLSDSFDLVNAIGVMFHIVDDEEWAATLAAVAGRLKPGGSFVVGGHFGLFDGVNVQIDPDGHINKRLRSRRHWIRALRAVGFSTFRYYRNRAYLWVSDSLPESNILVAGR